MRAKDLKKLVALLKPHAGFPIGDPCLTYEQGTFQAYNLSNVVARGHTEQTGFDATYNVARLLRALSRLKATDEVQMTPTGLVSGTTEYDLGVPPPVADFPDPWAFGDVLVTAGCLFPFAQVAPMRDTSGAEGKVFLSGILMETTLDGTTLVGCDGKRMGYHAIPVTMPPESAYKELQFVVPPEAVDTLCKMGQSSISGAWGKTDAVFSSGSVSLFVHHLDVDFPPWRKVIPTEHDWHMEFDRKKVLEALRRIDISPKKNDAHTRVVTIDFRNGRTMLAMNVDDMHATDELGCYPAGDFPHRISLDLLFFQEAVTHTQHPFIQGRGELDAVVVGGDNVIMPVRP